MPSAEAKGSRPPRDLARWRVVATHLAWIVLSWLIGFHLVAYFRSPYDLIGTLFREGRIYPTALAFHLVITVVTYLDFAVVRQTFCRYLCPYARFQGVLFDRDTLVIGYDEARGEPRGGWGYQTKVDARVRRHLLARTRSLVRHHVNLEASLVRQGERVVLHARGATEVAEHHNLRAREGARGCGGARHRSLARAEVPRGRARAPASGARAARATSSQQRRVC